MTFTRGQTDRFGRPIPPSPGIQILINDDGSEVQQRNRLILPDSLTVTDSEDNDASVLSLTVAPGDVTLAANSVLGNDTGSSAPGTSKPATTIGFGVLAAATQAELTALIAAANTSLAGLMSAADKVESNRRVTLRSSAFSASTTESVAWTANAYRRIEIFLRGVSGSATPPTLTFDGVTAGQVFATSAYLANGGAGVWTQTDQANANSANLTGMGQAAFCKIDADLKSAGSIEAFWKGRTANSLLTVDGGFSVGASGLVCTGITIAFGGASAGWLEVIGYP